MTTFQKINKLWLKKDKHSELMLAVMTAFGYTLGLLDGGADMNLLQFAGSVAVTTTFLYGIWYVLDALWNLFLIKFGSDDYKDFLKRKYGEEL